MDLTLHESHTSRQRAQKRYTAKPEVKQARAEAARAWYEAHKEEVLAHKRAYYQTRGKELYKARYVPRTKADSPEPSTQDIQTEPCEQPAADMQ